MGTLFTDSKKAIAYLAIKLPRDVQNLHEESVGHLFKNKNMHRNAMLMNRNTQ